MSKQYEIVLLAGLCNLAKEKRGPFATIGEAVDAILAIPPESVPVGYRWLWAVAGERPLFSPSLDWSLAKEKT